MSVNTRKENQHFVPRFYLKKFSNLNDERSIGVYLKDKQKFIRTGSIEGQAQKPFYYGKDGKVEDYLMEIETHASTVVSRICESQKIIHEPFEDYFRTLHFAVNLAMRNPTQAKLLQDADKGINKHVSGLESGEERNSNSQSELSNEESILFAVLQSSRISKLCLDLKLKLLINETNYPFITSDNPTIKYNSISEPYDWLSSSYASSGLQVFLPLSPTLMLFFYDPKTYKIKSEMEDTLIINKKSDVLQLNILQVLNCANCLYFNERISKDDIQLLINNSQKHSIPFEIKEMKMGSYFFQKITELKIGLKLENILPTDNQLNIPINSLIFPIREHVRKMTDFLERNDSGH